MRARQHDDRIADRALQSRGWAAPLPSPDTLSRVGEEPRMRMEWDTRDTMNNRMWDAVVQTGSKAVTPAMLAAHPTGGANVQMPTASRKDERCWTPSETAATPYFPNGSRSQATIQTPPTSSLYKSPWFAGMDVDKGDATRELRSVIREDHRFRGEDTSSRITGRMFHTLWIPNADAAQIVAAQLEASDKLRFGADDWRQQFRAQS